MTDVERVRNAARLERASAERQRLNERALTHCGREDLAQDMAESAEEYEANANALERAADALEASSARAPQ